MSRLARTRLALTLLGLLFLGRVAGQGLARLIEPAWLPPDALWHAGLTPYPVLLTIQIMILAAVGLTIARLDRIGPNPVLARALLAAGVAYLGVMLVRFGVGAAGLAPGTWFDRPISTPFHLILAAWLLVFAHQLADPGLRRRMGTITRHAGRALAYPLVVALAWSLFFWLRRHGVPVTFSAYLPVVLGAAAILILELATPYRRAWQPRRQVVAQDAIYLILVQVALPAFLTLAVAALIAGQVDGMWPGVWPTHWPVFAQAGLMIVLADFLRYWLHRGCHRFDGLWRLHAVHHAPHELYFLNVGRFHPLEKSLQFLFDAAPFILLGVSHEVVACYFVFYSVNGFFQHSNADVRLGPLNWIVAGPELHRWHHSRVIAESNNNYGNNLIVWDALFGTRFLPPREVGELGLRNRAYPTGFLDQTLAPVTTDPNRERAER